MLKLIDGIRRKRRLSLLFVSHDLDVVRLMCDRVMVLYLGRVAEIGPVGEVLSAPRHPYTRALIASMPGSAEPVATTRRSDEPDRPCDECVPVRQPLRERRRRNALRSGRRCSMSGPDIRRPACGFESPAASVNLRGINPDDAGDFRAGVAIAVGQMRLEEERIARLQLVGRAVDRELDLSRNQIARPLRPDG